MCINRNIYILIYQKEFLFQEEIQIYLIYNYIYLLENALSISIKCSG